MKFKSEAQFQTAFKGWLAENPPATTEVHELKLVKTGKFPLSTWINKYSHQARGLMRAKKTGCYHKISDMSMDLKPFDSFWIRDAKAYLVVYFNEFNQFVIVDVEDVLALTKAQKSVSFHELSAIGVPRSLS